MTEQERIEKETTSIKIDPELWKKARIQAIQHDLTMSRLIEEAVEKWIEERAKEKKGEATGKE